MPILEDSLVVDRVLESEIDRSILAARTTVQCPWHASTLGRSRWEDPFHDEEVDEAV